MTAGMLDMTFGGTGKVLGSFSANSTEIAYATVVDSQNRTLVAGSVDFGMGKEFAVFRFLADGKPDTTFAGTGRRYVSFNLGGGNEDYGKAIAIDSQGRILVAGTVDTAQNGKDIGVCRLTPNGMLDQSFDGDGRATFGFDLGGSKDDYCGSVLVDVAGRTLVQVYATDSSMVGAWCAVARLDDTGHLDTTFDVDGKSVVSFASGLKSYPVPSGMAFDSQGRVVIASRVTQYLPGKVAPVYVAGAARFLSDGALDTSFGAGGKRVIAPGPGEKPFYPTGIAIDAADRTVLVGTRGKRLSIMRLRSDGKIDATFGAAGKMTASFAFAPGSPGFVIPNNNGLSSKVVIDPFGNLVVATSVYALPYTVDVGVFRATPKGRLDKTFDGDGRVSVSFNAGGGDQDLFSDVAVDGFGRLIVTSTVTRTVQGDTDIGVARLVGG